MNIYFLWLFARKDTDILVERFRETTISSIRFWLSSEQFYVRNVIHFKKRFKSGGICIHDTNPIYRFIDYIVSLLNISLMYCIFTTVLQYLNSVYTTRKSLSIKLFTSVKYDKFGRGGDKYWLVTK